MIVILSCCIYVCFSFLQVFDCWFESGSMPYAYIHYPFENVKLFENNFPGHFVAEGLDQTRGWWVLLYCIFLSYTYYKLNVSFSLCEWCACPLKDVILIFTSISLPCPLLGVLSRGKLYGLVYLCSSWPFLVMEAPPLNFSYFHVNFLGTNT